MFLRNRDGDLVNLATAKAIVSIKTSLGFEVKAVYEDKSTEKLQSFDTKFEADNYMDSITSHLGANGLLIVPRVGR